MNHSVHFTISDPPALAAQKALSVINELGAPLKSDSGHFITGAIPHTGSSIEIHISWLPAGNGTQITVQATGEDSLGNAVFRAAERVRDTFLKTQKVRPTSASRGRINLPAIMVVLSLFAVVGLFFFILTHH